jgi:hypothetical protein
VFGCLCSNCATYQLHNPQESGTVLGPHNNKIQQSLAFCLWLEACCSNIATVWWCEPATQHCMACMTNMLLLPLLLLTVSLQALAMC